MDAAAKKHGGARPGAGRPSKTDARQMLQARVHPETLRILHALRGTESLGRYLDRAVVALSMAARPTDAPPAAARAGTPASS